jgi:hypothetical protein
MPAIPVGAALLGTGIAGAGASLVGGKMAANASRDAAKMQAEAANRAAALNQQAWQVQEQRQAPYLALGRSGVSQLQGLTTPGMPFGPQQQAMTNFQNAMASRPWNGGMSGPPGQAMGRPSPWQMAMGRPPMMNQAPQEGPQ